jgi:hypothetical protein
MYMHSAVTVEKITLFFYLFIAFFNLLKILKESN